MNFIISLLLFVILFYSEVMSTPVVVFRTVEKIGRIVKIIEGEQPHNGFPVVEDYDPYTSEFVSKFKFLLAIFYEYCSSLSLIMGFLGFNKYDISSSPFRTQRQHLGD